MTDRNVQYPNRYQLVKVPGTDDIYDLTPAPGTITAEGTMINKSTLLQDATAALYGLGADAVPDDVFSILKTLLDNNIELANEKAQVVYGSYVGTGYTIQKTITVPFYPFAFYIQGASGQSSGFPSIFLRPRLDSATAYQSNWPELDAWLDNGVTTQAQSSGQWQNMTFNVAGVTYYYMAIG